jgi:hypothetical protein
MLVLLLMIIDRSTDDKGMTKWALDICLPGFSAQGDTVEGITKPMKMTA